mgnify:CR=1 FL=1
MTMKKTDKQLIFSKLFPDEESCIRYYEDKRWGGNPVSPFDPSSKVYKCRNGKYKCKNTGRYFDVKTGTKFANTTLHYDIGSMQCSCFYRTNVAFLLVS